MYSGRGSGIIGGGDSMITKTMKVSELTHRRLQALGKKGDSFDMIIATLLNRLDDESGVLAVVKIALSEWMAIKDLDKKFRRQCPEYIGRPANEGESDVLASCIAAAEATTEEALDLLSEEKL